MTTKTLLVKAVFTPPLLYQSENWTLTRKERQMLSTTEMRCLRKAAGKTRMDKIGNEDIRRRVNMQSAEQTANKIRWWSHFKRMAPTAPRANTRDPARRTTTEGKATKSLGVWCTDMVQGDVNPYDRREQLCQGETSDCLSTRRRWQKSSTKVKSEVMRDEHGMENDVARLGNGFGGKSEGCRELDG